MSTADVTLYLSGPMTGYPDDNFPAFTEAAERLRAAGFNVVSPHEVGEVGTVLSWTEYLRLDLITMLEKCQAVATLPGWEQSRGASLECHVADALEMPRMPVHEWIDVATP